MSVSEKTRAQNGRNIWRIIRPINEFNFRTGSISITLELTQGLVASYKEK